MGRGGVDVVALWIECAIVVSARTQSSVSVVELSDSEEMFNDSAGFVLKRAAMEPQDPKLEGKADVAGNEGDWIPESVPGQKPRIVMKEQEIEEEKEADADLEAEGEAEVEKDEVRRRTQGQPRRRTRRRSRGRTPLRISSSSRSPEQNKRQSQQNRSRRTPNIHQQDDGYPDKETCRQGVPLLNECFCGVDTPVHRGIYCGQQELDVCTVDKKKGGAVQTSCGTADDFRKHICDFPVKNGQPSGTHYCEFWEGGKNLDARHKRHVIWVWLWVLVALCILLLIVVILLVIRVWFGSWPSARE